MPRQSFVKCKLPCKRPSVSQMPCDDTPVWIRISVIWVYVLFLLRGFSISSVSWEMEEISCCSDRPLGANSASHQQWKAVRRKSELRSIKRAKFQTIRRQMTWSQTATTSNYTLFRSQVAVLTFIYSCGCVKSECDMRCNDIILASA